MSEGLLYGLFFVAGSARQQKKACNAVIAFAEVLKWIYNNTFFFVRNQPEC